MSDASGSLKFGNIRHVGKGGSGILRLTADQLSYHCTDAATNTVVFAGRDIKVAAWHPSGPGRGLLKVCSTNLTGRFVGFNKDDVGKLRAHLQTHYKVTLLEQPVSTSGWSWGDWQFGGEGTDCGQDFQLMIGGKFGFEIPLSDLGQVSSLGKTDLNIELQGAEAVRGDEVLHEMRLVVPGGSGPPDLTCEQLKDELQRLAGGGVGADAEAIARIPNLAIVAPRGKHDFEFFQQFAKMHGKTQTYTIKYKNISRLFVLELPNDKQVALVIGLEPPLRQGQQSHSFLVLQMDKQREIVLFNIIAEEKARELNLTCNMEHELVSLLFKSLSGKQLTAPSSEFTSLNGSNCVKCTHKTQPGFLYPFKKSMIFMLKPVVWIRYDEVESVTFVSGVMRRTSYDLAVRTKNGHDVEFTQFDRKTQDHLFEFLRKAGVKINAMKDTKTQIQSSSRRQGEGSVAAAPSGSGALDDDEDDEDYEDGGDDSESASEDDDEDFDEESEEPEKKKGRKK